MSGEVPQPTNLLDMPISDSDKPLLRYFKMGRQRQLAAERFKAWKAQQAAGEQLRELGAWIATEADSRTADVCERAFLEEGVGDLTQSEALTIATRGICRELQVLHEASQ